MILQTIFNYSIDELECAEIDGHDHNEIRNAIKKAKESDKPSIIIGNTTIAKGSHSMENKSESHGARLVQKK